MNDEFAINERIAHLISEYGLSNADFAKKIGVPASSISHLLSKRNKPGLSFILSLLDQYKDIDANWLLTGVRSSRSNTRIDTTIETNLFSDYVSTNNEKIDNATADLNKNEVIAQEKNIPQKKIEKIVTFYTDKTFSVYLPE